MVQTLEDIKGGGGSVKIGTTGTISALMSRELQPKSSSGPSPSPLSSISTSASDTIPVKLEPTMATNDASSSSSSKSSFKNHKISHTQRKTRRQRGNSNKIPMLRGDNTSIDGTPARREKTTRKRSGVVEVVDIKCGHPDKTWVNPLANRLKKLGFSKLSESAN